MALTDLSNDEMVLILAGLFTISPSGGNSPQHALLMKLAEASGLDYREDDRPDLYLVPINEAIAYVRDGGDEDLANRMAKALL